MFNTKIALFNGLTDSDLTTVSNIRNDVDSDSIKIQDLQTQINNLVDDTGFDSDQIESMINEHVTPYDDSLLVARLDSDSIKIQTMQGQVDALVAGTYDDAPIVARLDSDSIRIQDLQTQINNLVDDTGFDSDQIESMINEHVTPFDDTNIIARLDSDSIVIQDLQTQINNIDVADLRSRLDSDSIIIQAIRTSVDSDYDLFNTKIALFNGLTDSDLTTVSNLRNDIDSDSIRIQDLQTQIDNLVDNTGFDSDQIESMINEHVTPYDDSGIIARLDSDSIKIQIMQGQVDALVAGTYDDSAIIARLDSDTAIIQGLRTNLDDSDFIIERTPLRLNYSSFSTTNANQVLDTYDKNEHKTVKYIISAKNAGGDWQSSEVLINHNGTVAYATEYAVMDSGAGDLYIADASVSSNDINLTITPQVTNITVSVIRTQID